MADRVTKVKLDLDWQGYVSGMNQAAAATSKVSTGAEKLNRTNEVVTKVATTATVAGTAVLALGAAALKTGIDYNSLQQRSRAALTSLLGSAEAANAQMEKLDAFARTSPFSKSTFITAQQQMLAFGIEAKKVVPYLDAIQNAVAAAGGSNADIEGIVATMSKIQSSAKVTAEDLNEFGNRGVNAAELIGSQMGKTGAQIREDITNGSLDATTALDALAAGMSENFAGAADNVKQTFDGAIDRVKAAWRDFSSELAKPLVNPEGGGALVDLLNWAADAMRAFQGLPEPVKMTTSALVFGAAAVAAFGGAAVLALPKVLAFKASLDALGLSAGKLKGAIGALGAAGLFAWAASAAGSFIDAQREAAGLKETVDSLSKSFDELGAKKTVENLVGDSLGARTDAGLFSDILTGAERFLDGAADFNIALKSLGVEGNLTSAKLATLDKTMAEMVAGGRAGDAARLYEELASKTNGSKDALSNLNDMLPAYTDAQSGAGEATDEASGELEEFTTSAEAAQEAVDSFVEALRGLGDTQLALNEANRAVEESLDAFQESIAENGATLDITTEAGRQNSAALDAIGSSYLAAAAAAVEHTGKQADAIPVINAGRDAIIAAGIAAGMSEAQAGAYADQLGLIPANVQTQVDLLAAEAMAAAQRMAQMIRDIPNSKTVYLYVQEQRQVLGPGQQGQTFAGANGMIHSYAQGGFGTGFYSGGTPIYKFAEPETRWEAFISGRPGQESRNRAIALEAYERLGGTVASGMGSAGPMSLDGLSITGRLDIGGDGLARIVDGRIHQAGRRERQALEAGSRR
jgi:tape measure domain-containing protein